MSKHGQTEENLIENNNLPTAENKTEKIHTEPLLTQENFKRLRQLQQDIFASSEMTPSFRKLINTFITDDSVQALKSKLLKSIQN